MAMRTSGSRRPAQQGPGPRAQAGRGQGERQVPQLAGHARLDDHAPDVRERDEPEQDAGDRDVGLHRELRWDGRPPRARLPAPAAGTIVAAGAPDNRAPQSVEEPPVTAPDGRLPLRHAVATLAYRAAKVLRDFPEA